MLVVLLSIILAGGCVKRFADIVSGWIWLGRFPSLDLLNMTKCFLSLVCLYFGFSFKMAKEMSACVSMCALSFYSKINVCFLFVFAFALLVTCKFYCCFFL
jgi:hypothetical protein